MCSLESFDGSDSGSEIGSEEEEGRSDGPSNLAWASDSSELESENYNNDTIYIKALNLVILIQFYLISQDHAQ